MPRPTPSPFVRALAALKGALAELNVSWYLFGAQAALIYGSSRATADLDLTVHLGQVTSRQLAAHLRSSGFRLRFKNVKFVDQTRVLPVVHETTDIAADLVIAGPGLEQLFLERSVQRKVGSVVLPVARLEDIVAMKVLAGRAKDRDDIVDILCANLKGVDLSLIRSTLFQLEEALDQDDLLRAFESMLAEAERRVTSKVSGTGARAKKRTKKPKRPSGR